MPIDLTGRTWPSHDRELMRRPEAHRLINSAYRTFVSEGALTVKAIDFGGQMRAIPRASSAIRALGLGDDVVYGATAGEQSWLVQYALRSYCEAAVPLGPLPEATETSAVVVGPGHRLVLAAGTADEHRLIRVTGLHLPGDVIQEWHVPTPAYETLAVPVTGERIACLKATRDNRLIGLSDPGGVVFTVDRDSGGVVTLGPVDPVRFFSPVLVEDTDGAWYAFGTLGRLLRIDLEAGGLEPVGLEVPTLPGRGPYAKVAAAVPDPVERRLVVGDTEGLLSVVYLDEGRVVPLGRPVALGGIDHLARLPDSRVFGVAGSRDGMAHLFCHDPRTGSLRDLGVCCATTEKGWYGYRFGAMVATPEGRLVLGEDDHLGCLMNYFPALG